MASIWGGDSPSVGWGQNTWQSNTVTQSLTAPTAITASLGDLAYAQSEEGWGRDTWGSNQWGEDGITGLDAIGSGLGTLSINSGADHSQGLASFAVTASVGSLGHTMAYDLTGVSTTGSVGSLTTSSVELIDITGVSTTASVGSISPTEMAVGLSGVSTTGSVGSISRIEMTMGLTGVSTTASVADMTKASGGGIIAYANIDTGSNISYSNISTGSNTSYSDVA